MNALAFAFSACKTICEAHVLLSSEIFLSHLKGVFAICSCYALITTYLLLQFSKGVKKIVTLAQDWADGFFGLPHSFEASAPH